MNEVSGWLRAIVGRVAPVEEKRNANRPVGLQPIEQPIRQQKRSTGVAFVPNKTDVNYTAHRHKTHDASALTEHTIERSYQLLVCVPPGISQLVHEAVELLARLARSQTENCCKGIELVLLGQGSSLQCLLKMNTVNMQNATIPRVIALQLAAMQASMTMTSQGERVTSRP